MRSKNLTIIIMAVAVLALTLVGCQDVIYDSDFILTVDSTKGGEVVEPGEGEFIYEMGVTVSLDVAAEDAFEFAGWIGPDGGDVVEDDGGYIINMNSNKEITANFSANPIYLDFEDYDIGDELHFMSWRYPDDGEALIADDPVNSGNKVLKFVTDDYNAVPVVEWTLPEDVSIADYSTFTFMGYFEEGDVGWKDIYVAVYTDEPSGEFQSSDSAIIGSWNRAQGESSEWEEVTIEIDASDDLTGTVYVAFGMSMNGGTWYADDLGFE